ncbi:unnamed protein product [Sphacelaria rigidula]
MAFAAKEFRYVRAEAPAAVLRNARREACMHLRVRSCERVIALCGIWLTPRLTLLLEAMDAGSFHHFIRRRALDRGDDENGSAVLDQEGGHKAAEGLAALHGAGIVHRDVKSHNVMMTNYNMPSSEIQERPLCEAKLGDLGSAAVLPTEGDSMLREEIGTSGWVAPEVFGDQGYGTPADIFSLGVLIWEAFTEGTLKNPLCGLVGQACTKALRDGVRPRLTPVVPVVVKQLIERCWAFEPSNRPTAEVVAAELRAFVDGVDPFDAV